ncbi:MAG: HEAT repeat domain-containing protein [Bacteroidota bacterium]
MKNDYNSYNRNEAAKHLGKSNLPPVIDALLETVRSDYKVRYQALVSLQKMKSTKALGTFIERLDDPSARIRKISIIALCDIGGKSAIEPIANIFNTRDHEERNQGIISSNRKTGKKPWGHLENVEAAKKALEKIREREVSPIPVKTVESQLKPLDTHYPFDDTSTGKRSIKSEDAKQHELTFIGRLGKKFEENGRTLKYNNKIFSINPGNDWGTYSNKKFSCDFNVPTNRYIEAKL